MLQLAVANAFNLPARRSAWIVPRASALQLSSAGISASLEKARSNVLAAAAAFGPVQEQAASEWLGNLEVGTVDVSSLLAEERALFEMCTLDDGDSDSVAVNWEASRSCNTASSHSTYRGWGDKRSTVAPWCAARRRAPSQRSANAYSDLLSSSRTRPSRMQSASARSSGGFRAGPSRVCRGLARRGSGMGRRELHLLSPCHALCLMHDQRWHERR